MDEDWKYINDRLSFRAELLWTDWNLISESKYKQDLCRGKFKTAQRGCRGNKAYLFFEDVQERSLKEMIRNIEGCDPYDLASQNLIKGVLVIDQAAREFFRDYRYNGGKSIPVETQVEYTYNASMLKLLWSMANRSKRERRTFGQNTEAVWRKLSEQASQLDKKAYPHSLPANWRILKDKASEFGAAWAKDHREAYKLVIHRNFGNTSAEKLTEPARMWALAKWGSMVDKVVSYTDLLDQYNKKAKEEGWMQLKSDMTLRNYLEHKDVRPIWEASRLGELKFAQKYGYQHQIEPTGMRDCLWYSDGTKVNCYYLHTYTDKEGRTKHTPRTTSVYEVMDDYSEYLLGYCISDSEDYISAFNAYRMAMQTAGHKPYQVSFDNGSGNLKLQASGFFDSMSHLNIRTKPYHGNSKTIESAFGRFQSQYLKKDWFFTGQNMGSKKDESKANMEFINANIANLPTLEELREYYRQRRDEWNAAPHPRTKKPREQMYRESVNAQCPAIAKQDMVDLFWIMRTDSVQVDNSGIEFQDRNVKYRYTPYKEDGLPDQEWIMFNLGKSYFIKWDPADAETIWLYSLTPQGLRQVRELRDPRTVQVLHRGKQEQTEGEAQYFRSVDTEGKDLRIKMRDQFDEILEQHNLLPEQHGLNSPKLSGIEGRRKKAADKAEPKQKGAKPISMAKTMKDESYADELELVEIDAEQAEIERQLKRLRRR